jgi:glycosyltransferase involved in cell wall biosynthesis
MSLSPPAQSRRLTMVITELDVGGAEKAFVRVAIGLQNLGWDVRVVSLRDTGPLATLLEAANIEVSALQAGGLLDVRAIWRLRRELLRRPADVLLTFLHQANLVGRIAGRLTGVRRIVCGIRVADRRLVVSLPERLTKGMVDRYVAVSQSVGGLHRNICQIDADRMITIPNGVDLEAIDAAVPATRSEMGCGPDDQIILCVGRLSRQKAPLDALEAFHLMISSFPELKLRARLLFIGEGELRPELQRRVDELGLHHSVQLPGWRPDVWRLMKSANVLVLASHWEGLPNVILEAQAAGLPVVATAVDGSQELIRDQLTGRLVPRGDVKALANALGEILQNTAAASQMSRNARNHVAEHHQWSTCIDKYDELLNTFL